MDTEKRSLVLQYDEEKDAIVFFSVPTTTALALRNDEAIEMPMADFRALTPDEAERRVGEGIFSAFDSFSTRKTGIRDYAGDLEREFSTWIADLEPAAKSGDPKAQYDLSTLYRDLAMRRRSWEDFENSESLLRASASSGYPAALEALRDWDIFRDAFTRRVQRASAA